MPYRWLPPEPGETARLRLWPHRSLPATGFVTFIALTAALLAIPLMAQLGTPALWVLLPFLIAALAAIWIALQRSYRDGEITEDLTLTPARLTLMRDGPRRQHHEFETNPYWARLTLYPAGGPVPNYLTIADHDREVELGAFLSEPERLALRGEVQAALARARAAPPLSPASP